MFKLPETSLIIGSTREPSSAFVELALEDYENVMLVSSSHSFLDTWPTWNMGRIQTIQQDLWSLEAAQNILEESHTLMEFSQPSYPITLLVNLIEFVDIDPFAAWENQTRNPSIDIPQLMEINDLFYYQMCHLGKGEILNVVSRPANCHELVTEMFFETQMMLMEAAREMNENSPSPDIQVHTMSYSPQSFVLQTDSIPAHVAHDLVPDSCSAKDIADYGFQILQARRGTSN